MATRTKRKAKRRPAWQTDAASITRPLKNDSETLRYAEWWVRTRLYGFEDAEARWLYSTYLATLRDMNDVIRAGYRNGEPDLARLDETLEAAAAVFQGLKDAVFARTRRTSVKSFRQGYWGRAWAIDASTKHDGAVQEQVNARILPTEAIEAALTSPYLGKPWHYDLGMTFDEYVAIIRRVIADSLIAGDSMDEAFRRLRDTLGIPTDRRKGFRKNFFRVLTITRTEIQRAANLGALAVYEQNADVVAGYEWVSSRDERVCTICQGLDGKTWTLSDPERKLPPGDSHQNCRCTIVPVLVDTEIQDALAPQRPNYYQWRDANVADDDGGLGDAGATDAGGMNEV